MIYTDEQLKRWWSGLSKQDQREILGTMCDKMAHKDFALSLSRQYQQGKEFSPSQLHHIRKWAPR